VDKLALKRVFYNKSKYGNVKTKVDDILFDSKKEANRYCQLKLLAKAGTISELELQPKFDLVVNGLKICSYIADFKYVKDDQIIIEDVKGVQTPEFKLKKKLMKAVHGIDVLIS
jgi:hypothetical protein